MKHVNTRQKYMYTTDQKKTCVYNEPDRCLSLMLTATVAVFSHVT